MTLKAACQKELLDPDLLYLRKMGVFRGTRGPKLFRSSNYECVSHWNLSPVTHSRPFYCNLWVDICDRELFLDGVYAQIYYGALLVGNCKLVDFVEAY